MRIGLIWTLPLILIASLGGCSQPQVSQQQVETAIEDDFLQLLRDLTTIMQAGTKNPGDALTSLRNYIQSSNPSAKSTVKALHRAILDMDPQQREVWKISASKKLEIELERFANAQILLQNQLNDAQKWELGQILALLK